MQISKVIGIKCILYTDICEGCIYIYHAVICLDTLKVILTYKNAQHTFRWALILTFLYTAKVSHALCLQVFLACISIYRAPCHKSTINVVIYAVIKCYCVIVLEMKPVNLLLNSHYICKQENPVEPQGLHQDYLNSRVKSDTHTISLAYFMFHFR